ncbi:MAG: bifunctional metallophosphatase/5'-nucleotidase [Elusimicrobia bacterium]|nr:bifunctional metallophosphatase/5'-nucleotidase [Elusimicrobiota bacterium]
MKKLSALLSLFTLLAANAAAGVVAVYHTSDVHGWYSARPAAWDKDSPKRLIGGFAALSALLMRETTPYLLLDSGDTWQGTPEGILTKGMASVTLMNQLGYGAMVPGNHDFDAGEAPLKAMAAGAKFPVLGANVYISTGPAQPQYLKPYIFINKAGHKLAVLGLMNQHTSTLTLPAHVKHLTFRDEGKEAAAWLEKIEEQKPDAVIAIAHLGISEEYSLKNVDLSTMTFEFAPAGTLRVARAAPGINLLLGGHHHTGLLHGYADPVSASVLGESGYGLSYVTRAELTFDDATGQLSGVSAELVPLWVDKTGEDPAVLKTIAGFNAQVDKAMGRVVGRAKADLGFSKEGLDAPLASWLCDVTRAAAKTDFAVHNTRALRAEIKKGPVRLRDLFQAMPFDNTVFTMRLTGAQLWQLVADNIGKNASIQVSGFDVEFAPGPLGHPEKLRLLKGRKELDMKKEYTLATNSYLAGGGDGGAALAGARDTQDTMVLVRDLMERAFKAGPVTPPATGRIRRIK